MESVCAIIVSYKPDHARLTSLVDAIHPQVRHVVVVDNGSGVLPPLPSAEVIRLPTNMGLGTAHNVGMAKAADYEFGLLMDQDSMPAADMVERLTAGYRSLVSRGVKVAAVGPNYFDLTSKEWMRNSNEDALEVETLGSSGTLIPVKLFRAVGPFREDLFIDYVDFEWCLRASAHGRCFIVTQAKMTHELGTRRVFLFGCRVYYGGLTRLYYIFRNATYLYTHSRYPLKWKVRDAKGKGLAILAALLGRLPDGRRRTIPKITKGIFHGVIGRLGPWS